MFGDVHLRAVRDHFDLLAATADDRSRCPKRIPLVFGRSLVRSNICFFLRPVSVVIPLAGFETLSDRQFVPPSMRRPSWHRNENFLNLFRQFREVNLRDSRTGYEHNAVGFNSADRDVFVFFPVNRLEVVHECD